MSERITWCLLLLVAIVAAPAAATSWYESYADAEKALADERWDDAARHLIEAIDQRPSSGANLRTYGMRFVDYYPYLKLGVAYYHLGQPAAALDAFATESSQGEVRSSSEATAQLERFERLAREQLTAVEQEQAARIAEVVRDAVDAAVRLEQLGRFEDALVALSPALAVAEDDPDAQSLRSRLLEQMAEERRQRGAEERVSSLLGNAERQLAEGLNREAAATASQALEVRPGDERAAKVLARAQRAIRDTAADDSERQRLERLQTGLERARELESGGLYVQALEQVQGVLAIDPENSAAVALQARLLGAQSERDAAERRTTTVASLLTDAESRLAAGEHRQCLRLAHRVLAEEPQNPDALALIQSAHAALSSFLVTDSRPPVIVLDELNGAELDGEGRHLLRSRQLRLSGTVFDVSPVQLEAHIGDATPTPLDTNRRELEGLWLSTFGIDTELPRGAATVTVVARDERGLETRESLVVRYQPPIVRGPYVAVVIVLLLVSPGGFWLVRRWRRRRQALERRFNPYIAGAPITNAQLYFGRKPLLDYVLRRITNNSVLLYGERRIGKTSFQHQLRHCLEELDDPDSIFYPVFIDLQGTPQERFFATLAAEIFSELEPVLGDLEPNALIDDGDRYGYRELVKDLRRVLEVLKKRSDKKTKLVLQIDEVDELNDYDPRINQKLRSLFMRTFADSLVSVVSGVGIKKHWEREGSPWYNFFQEVEVEPLNASAARELVTAPVRGVFSFADGVADEIVRRTDARPYRIQRLCSRIVDRLHEEGRTIVTMADVEDLHDPDSSVGAEERS